MKKLEFNGVISKGNDGSELADVKINLKKGSSFTLSREFIYSTYTDQFGQYSISVVDTFQQNDQFYITFEKDFYHECNENSPWIVQSEINSTNVTEPSIPLSLMMCPTGQIVINSLLKNSDSLFIHPIIKSNNNDIRINSDILTGDKKDKLYDFFIADINQIQFNFRTIKEGQESEEFSKVIVPVAGQQLTINIE